VGWDAGTYGAAFADVYDEWYGERGDEADVVARVAPLAPGDRAGRLLELGVGTGRLALPLADAGWSVVGLDASPEMLAVLAGKVGGRSVEVVHGDASEPVCYPAATVDVVLAAFNFLANLADPAAQASCLAAARAATRDGGWLAVECFVPAARVAPGRVESAAPWSGVRIVSETDPDGRAASGEHVAADGRRRPWRVLLAPPDELDERAAAAGWSLVERTEDWAGAPFDPEASPTHVSLYRTT
jgi:SAM-dependent methyltransferase